MLISAFDIGGLNLQQNPLNISPNEMIRAVNVDSYEFGALKKRSGYTTFLGTADGVEVNSLLDFHRNDTSEFWLYRSSGSALYNSLNGTAAWTLSTNGTITDTSHLKGTVLEDVFICVGGGTTRHTTNGGTFTDTTSAPVAVGVVEYQQRVHAIGTSSNDFYSTTGTATDWTTDSSSINIPGAGKLLAVYKANDRIIETKNSGAMFRYDGYSLVDMATNMGPTSAESIGNIEGIRFGLNRHGVCSYTDTSPTLISNKIRKQIYNDAGGGIVGTVFDSAPGIGHLYDYYVSVGNVTDDLTNEVVNNAIIKYNAQLNSFVNYSFADFPTSWLSFKDSSKVDQLIFGDATGQCYQIDGTVNTDNGKAIEAIAEFVIHLGTIKTKTWKWLRMLFNPGCQAKVQIAITDTFIRGAKKWIDLGSATSGVIEKRFPQGTDGTFLFLKISDASANSRFVFYGYEAEADVITR